MRNYILCLFILIVNNLHSQNYVGLHKDSLAVLLKKYEVSFKLDNSAVNNVYKYLKYVDGINEQTWLFFIDDRNICTYHKLMSDYLNYEETIKKYNEKYGNAEKQIEEVNGDKPKKIYFRKWVYRIGEKAFTIKMTEEEWYFSVVTREKTE